MEYVFTGTLASAIMKVPPNKSSSDKLVEHNGEEVTFVLEGKIKVFLDGEEYILLTGDRIKIPAYLKYEW
ncbi:hypothetical protein DFO73_103446 [Cytobacillus oceanisediminis]|uniref:Cupin type-2 domain-containing protein n=1 Tax=Cytobacillus oceanisediminis TaxID=665099 RepID=A0A2V3A6M9_9BACI|nr:hypothetical protein DFO73_103446 [Cytobacillus oceanisediminis]